MCKGFVLFDCLLSLLLISVYLPLLIQGILMIHSTLLMLQSYQTNLTQLHAYIHHPSLSFDGAIIDHSNANITTFYTHDFGLPIRWVTVSP